MADEIDDQNVIRVFSLGGTWAATIGPADGRGLTRIASTPSRALALLVDAVRHGCWCFDPDWKPAA